MTNPNTDPVMLAVLKRTPYFKNATLANEFPNVLRGTKSVVSKLMRKTIVTVLKHKSSTSGLVKTIMKSNGDITKCEFYKSSKLCMDNLMMLSKRGGGIQQFVKDTATIHEFLIDHRDIFKKAAKNNAEHTINMCYLTLAMTWTICVSIGIAYGVKVTNGAVITWNKVDKLSTGKKKQLTSKIHDLAECIKTNKLLDALVRIQSSKSGNESIAAAVILALGGVLLLLYFARWFVMLFLTARVSISDWLRNQSSFVKISSKNNDALTEDQLRQQDEDAALLDKIADIIDVDLETEVLPKSKEFELEAQAVVRAVESEPSETVADTEVADSEFPAQSTPVSGLNF